MGTDTIIFLIYSTLFVLFFIRMLYSLFLRMKVNDVSKQRKEGENIIFCGRITVSMWPLMFLTVLVKEVFFVYDSDMVEIRQALFGFIVTLVIFVVLILRTRQKKL